jgi:hypothetical protein
MPLPFPHGYGPGQIANGHNYDVNDTPGFPGGRFVGFGEDATSAIANRPAWALSSNIDYIYQKYAAPIAIPQMDKFISEGASSYDLTALIFCGDDTYPPDHDAAEGLMLLFSVLDDQYNALTDGDGNEVRVSRVMDTADTNPVYGTGFVQSPVVHFCTVNPKTGVLVLDPYLIPADQVVRIAYGVASSLESLPVDAFTRYKVMSGEEVPAGVLLLDGSLPMAGDMSMGGHNISSCAGITNEDSGIQIDDYLLSDGSHNIVGFYGISNNGIPVQAEDGFDGQFTGSLQNFGSLELALSSGIAANLNVSGSPGSASCYLQVFDPGVAYNTLQLDATSLSASSSLGYSDLGTSLSPWGNLYTAALYLLGDALEVNSGNLLSNAFEVPLFSPDDYVFPKEDFTQPLSYGAADPVGSWLMLYGSVGVNMEHVLSPYQGRSTVNILKVAAGSASTAWLAGPLLLSPSGNMITARAGLCIPVLSSGEEPFNVWFGFNVDATGSEVCAFLQIDSINGASLLYSDGSTPIVAYPLEGFSVAADVWYDCDMSFTADHVILTINGAQYANIPLAIPDGTSCTFVPAWIEKVGGSNLRNLLIDYAELYTRGHQSRNTGS